MFVVYRLPFAVGAAALIRTRSMIGQSRPCTRCGAQRSFHTLNQSSKHLLHIDSCPIQSLRVFGRQKSQILRQQKKVNQLVCRSGCDVRKLPKFGVRSSSTSFRDIGWNRRGGPRHLADQTKSLGIWIPDGGAVNTQSEQMALLPEFQELEVLHRETSHAIIRNQSCFRLCGRMQSSTGFDRASLFFCPSTNDKRRTTDPSVGAEC